MAGTPNRLESHWKTFQALRQDYRLRRIVLGIDRTHAHKWAILGGEGCPVHLHILSVLLVVVGLAAVAGAAYTVWMGLYLLPFVLFIVAFLSVRLVTYLAVASARATAIRDEALFRRWFRERLLSVYIKKSGEYVWNDGLSDE